MLSIARLSDQGWLLEPCFFSRSAIAAFQSSIFPKRIAGETVQQMEYTGNRPSQTRSSIRR